MVKEFEIPWAAWREPETLKISFPDSWDVNLYKMNGAESPEITDEQIKNAILNPFGTPNISELAQGKKSVVIAVDDMTRTTPVNKILPIVFEELKRANISKDQITIILALGAHRPMNRNDCILKLGKEIVETINIENHHPYENLTSLGESKAGTPIDVNTTYYNADLKIAVGGVIPHPLAGFGGGAKIILPGVCGIRTLEGNHSAGMRGIGAGIGKMTKIREDIEFTAERVGLDFSINTILTENGKISAITAGHFKDAHRKAMEIAKENYSTKYPLDNQICFFNLFPEDSELNQAVKGFNFLMTASNKILDRKGTIVLMSSSYEGRGYHSLIAETGAKLYANFGDGIAWLRFVRKRIVCFYSPNISKHDLNHFYPESTKLFNNWDNLIKHLNEVYGDTPKAAVFPCSIQLAE
jgi:nickel-dependent lactate racemase